jgi:hypothetical protein
LRVLKNNSTNISSAILLLAATDNG